MQEIFANLLIHTHGYRKSISQKCKTCRAGFHKKNNQTRWDSHDNTFSDYHPYIDLSNHTHHNSLFVVVVMRFLPRAHALGVKQLVLSVRPSVCHTKKKLKIVLTISKQQDNDEMWQILAYVYLVEHKSGVSLSIFTFF